MVPEVIAVFIPIIFISLAAAVTMQYLKTRHKERMSLIEKGVSGEDLKYLLNLERQRKPRPVRSAMWGILLICVGLAILIGNLVSPEYQEEFTISFIFLFPGIGLLLYYRFFSSHESGDSDQD